MSRVEGILSRVEGSFVTFFFSFGRKISRLSGIYRKASMSHAFPLFGASYFFHVSGERRRVISLVCFACYKFRLFGLVFF